LEQKLKAGTDLESVSLKPGLERLHMVQVASILCHNLW